MHSISFILLLSVLLFSCKKESTIVQITESKHSISLQPIDTTKIDSFFTQHPLFIAQKREVKDLYHKKPQHIWFDTSGRIEFAGVLFDQAINMTDEGIAVTVPYREKIEKVIFGEADPNLTSELLLSCLYFFYTDHVLKGLKPAQSAETKWFLPRDNKSYTSLLDSLIGNPRRLSNGTPILFGQYYNLRIALRKYRKIAANGGWSPIDQLPKKQSLKPGDSSIIISQIRDRLFSEGYLTKNSSSAIYDSGLEAGISDYFIKQHRTPNSIIGNGLINELNITVDDRIKTIIVNMERCRWISPEISNAPRFLAVNIPSYQLRMIEGGKSVFISKVVVGKDINKTVVFSGEMTYIVFSPYWNVPKSIVEKEIMPAIQKNRNYLAKQNMEWYNGNLRQRPGKNNSLGLVKFMFPNSNNIYLHDTPAKSLFEKDERAFSHGCIRVERARELAVKIMADEADWTPAQVDQRMNAGKESFYSMKKPIPVYIAYFTAWADDEGNTSFYKDIYDRDEKLLQMLYR